MWPMLAGLGPIIGDGALAAGVSVLAGHRDTHFRALESVAVGERFDIERPDGQKYGFAIDVIDAPKTSVRLDGEGSRVVLVTCWPFDAVTPRRPAALRRHGRAAPGAGSRFGMRGEIPCVVGPRVGRHGVCVSLLDE